MKGDFHVRFDGSGRGKSPPATLLLVKGADRPVVVMKPGNAGGAKGTWRAVWPLGQSEYPRGTLQPWRSPGVERHRGDACQEPDESRGSRPESVGGRGCDSPGPPGSWR